MCLSLARRSSSVIRGSTSSLALSDLLTLLQGDVQEILGLLCLLGAILKILELFVNVLVLNAEFLKPLASLIQVLGILYIPVPSSNKCNDSRDDQDDGE